MTQLDLFGTALGVKLPPAGYVLPDLIAQPPSNGTDTSNAAADRIAAKSRTTRDEGRILAWLRTTGGKTDDEIQKRFQFSGDYERPRRWSLVRAGLVEDSGDRRTLATGNTGKVWRGSMSHNLPKTGQEEAR